jgi:hypothetical protein
MLMPGPGDKTPRSLLHIGRYVIAAEQLLDVEWDGA